MLALAFADETGNVSRFERFDTVSRLHATPSLTVCSYHFYLFALLVRYLALLAVLVLCKLSDDELCGRAISTTCGNRLHLHRLWRRSG